MADVKIQDLLATTTVADTDLFIVEDNADTKKITKANLVSTLGINGKAPTVHGHSMSQITDYQEGTWIPVARGVTTAGVGTYTSQAGRYTKIGRMVYFQIRLSWSSHTGSGILSISLPIMNGDFYSPCSILSSNLNYSGSIITMILPNSQEVWMFSNRSNDGIGVVQIPNSVSEMYISGFYMV